MWSFKPSRRAFVLGAAVLPLVAACGFQPVLAPESASGQLLSGLSVREPGSASEYVFAERMEERIGRNAGDLQLNYSISIGQSASGITRSQVTNRYMVTGRVTFSVAPVGGGEALYSGVVTAFTGYSATGSTVATQAASRDAEERIAIQLADQTISRLMAEANLN